MSGSQIKIYKYKKIFGAVEKILYPCLEVLQGGSNSLFKFTLLRAAILKILPG